MKPTFTGFIETEADALILIEACIQGFLEFCTCRIPTSKRSLLKSGHIYLYKELQSSIKRWTDGRNWSPSRIQGKFLIYKELNHRLCEGSLNFKDDGLIKKTFSVRVDGEMIHIVCYYTQLEVVFNCLLKPSNCETFLQLVPNLGFRNYEYAKYLKRNDKMAGSDSTAQESEIASQKSPVGSFDTLNSSSWVKSDDLYLDELLYQFSREYL